MLRCYSEMMLNYSSLCIFFHQRLAEIANLGTSAEQLIEIKVTAER